MLNKILIILNPYARQSWNIPVLFQALHAANITYDVQVTHKAGEAYDVARQVEPGTYSAVAAAGGDGTVAEVVRGIYGRNIPLLILPLGTSNGVARELGYPGSLKLLLEVITDGNYQQVNMDVGLRDGTPFIQDVHYGVFARAVFTTHPAFKTVFGGLSYYLNAFWISRQAPYGQYHLEADGKKISGRAALCIISNNNPMKIFGRPLFPQRSGNDGLLEVVLVHNKSLWRLAGWYLGRLTGRDNGMVTYLQAGKVKVQKAPMDLLCDDVHMHTLKPYTISVDHQALPVIMPEPLPALLQAQRWARGLRINLYRLADHLQRRRNGVPYRWLSQVSDDLFIGGRPSHKGKDTLRQWGVTAIVSMQRRAPVNFGDEFKVLHLPTRDHDPVAFEDLEKGAEFIAAEVARGGKVYIHCMLGEGRAASMAIAYFMTTGLSTNEAWAHIKNTRIFIRPNRRQIKQLRLFMKHTKKPVEHA